jgi:hypothetical protein
MAKEADGAEGSHLMLGDDGTVVIERHGLFAGLRQGRSSVTSIRDITGVHVAPPRMGFRGWIQLLVGSEQPTTWTGANQHPRAMYFNRDDYDDVEAVAAEIRALLPQAGSVVLGEPSGPGPDPHVVTDPKVGHATILVVSSNPTLDPKEPRLATDEEENRIRDALEKSPHGRRYELELRPATRIDDLLGYLLDQQPTVLHMSGHGVVGGLVGTAADGHTPVLANPMGLAQLVALPSVAKRLRVLILSACLSVEQAKFLAQWVPYVVGTIDNVPDQAAIRFAHGFYTALGHLQPVGDAYAAGVAQAELLMPGASGLYTWASTLDPATLRLLA